MTNILRKGTIIKPKGKKNKMDFLKRAWAEVDLDSIEYNLKEYRRLIGGKNRDNVRCKGELLRTF